MKRVFRGVVLLLYNMFNSSVAVLTVYIAYRIIALMGSVNIFNIIMLVVLLCLWLWVTHDLISTLIAYSCMINQWYLEAIYDDNEEDM